MAMHEGYGGGVNGAGAGARGGVVITGDRGGIAGSEVDSCGACCFEAEEPVRTEDKWVYVGDGHGSYAQATHMQMVGHGRGDFERETHAQVTGYRCRACCVVLGCLLFLLALLLPIGFANGWWSRYFASYFDAPDQCMTTYSPNFMARTDANALFIRQMCCARGYAHYCVAAVTQTPRTIVVHDRYYTQVKDVPVPHTVPVPIPAPPPKVITHKVMVHTHAYDCDSGLTDYMHTWTPKKQRYCCYLRHIACHTKVTYRPHYHTITKVKHITVPVHVPIPAPPPKVVNKVVNVPIHDPPKVIKVPVPGKPHVVPKYVHKKVPVPVPQPTPPKYHTVRVPVKIRDPGKTIKVPVQMPPRTIVKNRVIYKTRHVKVQHIYDCNAGYSNWHSGWSSAKKSWCCSHESKGCPGDHSGHLTKTVVTHVTSHMGPEYYSHHYSTGHTTGHYHYHSYHSSPATVVHHVHHYHYGSVGNAGYHSGTTGYHSGATGYHSGTTGYHGGTTVVHHHHYYHARRLQEANATEVVDGGKRSMRDA
ncbi:unnamed protein product [Durusdinium trenchii]|uniref:Uncharacterized protein n=1 Tax=Durusdinium trenchii TaxID=1381693 RepID=A0ABP0HG84_9DINO